MHYEFLGKIMGKFFQKKIQIEWHAVPFLKLKITHLNILSKKILLGVQVEHLASLIHVRDQVLFPE